MARLTPWAIILATLLFTPALPAAAVEFCATHAGVDWVVDHERATVLEAHVEVPGCTDGAVVGLQLLTEDGGELPSGPLLAETVDQRAVFDLRPLAVRIEPLTGVRVYLSDLSDTALGYEITIERRFFNPAGNEQRGLRETSTIHVPLGESYTVAGPPDRYRVVACRDVGVEPADHVLDEGPGTFEPRAAGSHLTCSQQVAGPRNDTDSNDTATDVLDAVLDGGPGPDAVPQQDVDDIGVSTTAGTARSALPRTGVDVWALLALGVVLGALGAVVRSWRRTDP